MIETHPRLRSSGVYQTPLMTFMVVSLYSIKRNWFLMNAKMSYALLFVCFMFQVILARDSAKQLRFLCKPLFLDDRSHHNTYIERFKKRSKGIVLQFRTLKRLHLYQAQSLPNCLRLLHQQSSRLQFCFTIDISSSEFSHHHETGEAIGRVHRFLTSLNPNLSILED